MVSISYAEQVGQVNILGPGGTLRSPSHSPFFFYVIPLITWLEVVMDKSDQRRIKCCVLRSEWMLHLCRQQMGKIHFWGMSERSEPDK